MAQPPTLQDLANQLKAQVEQNDKMKKQEPIPSIFTPVRTTSTSSSSSNTTSYLQQSVAIPSIYSQASQSILRPIKLTGKAKSIIDRLQSLMSSSSSSRMKLLDGHLPVINGDEEEDDDDDEYEGDEDDDISDDPNGTYQKGDNDEDGMPMNVNIIQEHVAESKRLVENVKATDMEQLREKAQRAVRMPLPPFPRMTSGSPVVSVPVRAPLIVPPPTTTTTTTTSLPGTKYVVIDNPMRGHSYMVGISRLGLTESPHYVAPLIREGTCINKSFLLFYWNYREGCFYGLETEQVSGMNDGMLRLEPRNKAIQLSPFHSRTCDLFPAWITTDDHHMMTTTSPWPFNDVKKTIPMSHESINQSMYTSGRFVKFPIRNVIAQSVPMTESTALAGILENWSWIPNIQLSHHRQQRPVPLSPIVIVPISILNSDQPTTSIIAYTNLPQKPMLIAFCQAKITKYGSHRLVYISHGDLATKRLETSSDGFLMITGFTNDLDKLSYESWGDYEHGIWTPRFSIS